MKLILDYTKPLSPVRFEGLTAVNMNTMVFSDATMVLEVGTNVLMFWRNSAALSLVQKMDAAVKTCLAEPQKPHFIRE
jgi:hypothetical protein